MIKSSINFLYLLIVILFLSCVAGKEESSVSRAYVSPFQTIEILSPSQNLSYNSSIPATIMISGSCSISGESFRLLLNDSDLKLLTCTEGSFSSVLDSNLLVEGENKISIVPINGIEKSISILIDTVDPVVTFDNIRTVNQSNQSQYVLEGSCSDNGRAVSGSFDVLPFSSTCNQNRWSSNPLNLSFYADNTYTASISMSDSVGNTSSVVTENIVKDTTTPLPILSFVNPISGQGNSNQVVVNIGSINIGDSIVSYSDSSCFSSIRSDISVGTDQDITLTNSAEGLYSYYFIITDSLMNSSPCLGPLVYVEDQTPPTDPLTVSMTSPGDGESSNDSTPEISGTINSSEEGATIRAFRDASCSEEIGASTVSSGEYSILGSLAVDGTNNGLNQFYLQTTDLAGNSSVCFSTGLSYTLGGSGLASLPKLAMVGSDSPSSLVSLEDGNEIIWTKASDPSNPINLGVINRGDIISIEDPGDPSDKVDQGDLIESTKACYVVTQGFGTAPWASDAYAGKRFSTHQFRYGQHDPKVFVAAISQTSFVQILQDTDNDGDLDVVDFFNVPAGTVHEFTLTLVNGRPWQIVATENINAYYVSRSNGSSSYTRDAFVLTPADTDIVGFSYYITAIEDATSFNAYQNRSGTNFSSTISTNQTFETQRTQQSSLAIYATRVISDKPVSQLQIADGNGTNASPHLPVRYLATHYGVPRNADYVGIIALEPTTVDVFAPDGTLQYTRTLVQTAGADPLAPYAFKHTDGGTVAAGTTFECSSPCFMLYDDEGSGADRDETLMMGYTP